jgi:hypothetical protein
METGSLCWSGRIQLAILIDLTIVDDSAVMPPWTEGGYLFHKCQQIRIQLSWAFASHIFYRLAAFPPIPSSANWLQPD